MTQLTPTLGAQWRKAREEGVVVTLPSGNVARLRPVALDVLVTSGEVPDLLTPLAARMLYGEVGDEELQGVAEVARGTAKLCNLVCRAAFVEPRIVDDPQAEDEVALEDVDFTDRMAVFQVAIQGARSLETFRDQQEKRLGALRDGEGDGQQAE